MLAELWTQTVKVFQGRSNGNKWEQPSLETRRVNTTLLTSNIKLCFYNKQVIKKLFRSVDQLKQ